MSTEFQEEAAGVRAGPVVLLIAKRVPNTAAAQCDLARRVVIMEAATA